MRHLLACTAIAPVLVAIATQAAAETTISTATTTAAKTSTIKSGAPDDLTVSSAGSITLTSGTAITQDSDNKVSNAGTLKITGADNATAILSTAGRSGDITHSGTITLDEDYTATDTDSDGDLDGPFAKGANRNGIWVQSGGTHSGAITTSGTITIEGNNSAGIRIDAPLVGNIATSGTIGVTGDNSFGVVAGGDVTGNVTLRGTITTVGGNSVGAALLGDVNGAVKIQGTIASTGYRSTTRPTDVSKLDADDLLQGGGALKIAGNVTGGIIFDIPPTNQSTTDTDVDDDGLTDSTEGSASVVNYGSAAAVQIGSADRDTSVGAVAAGNTGYGLIVKGGIAGYGVYDGISASGLVIGGLGGDVTLAKGALIQGTIVATSYDSSATAMRVGSGATAGTVEISGTVNASGASKAGTTATGLQIDAGAHVDTVKNSGTISSIALSTDNGTAVAIRDAAGTVSSLSNTGTITATGGKTNIAIDLSANTGGITLTQAAASATAAAPVITGDIRLGSGNDSLSASAGTITGNLSFGEGNDSLALSGTGKLSGNVTFGAGTSSVTLADTASYSGAMDMGGGVGSITLSNSAAFSGSLANGGQTALVLNGGSFSATNSGSVALASLSASSGSAIGVTINADAGTHTMYDVAGAANFASGSLVKATLTNVNGSAGDYVIVRAGSLTGAPALSTATLLPYMFKGTVSGDTATGEVKLSIAAKSASELGLSGSLARAYPAIFAALDNDADVANAYLAVSDGTTLNANLRQMLPDHAGGAFEAVTSGSRATARILSDPNGIYRTADGRLGFWLQQVAFGGSKSIGDTASYDINGWGAGFGAEYLTGIGAFGGSFAYIHASDSAGEANNEVDSDQFELAAHWRGDWGPLQAFARVSGAKISFDGTRTFESGTTKRTAEGSWNGTLWSATAGASYEMHFDRFSLRPALGIDYYRLREKGYAETGGGDAFNLVVDGRTSDELTANGTVTLGYDFGSLTRADGWVRFEVEGGRRQIIGGSLGDTTARYDGGQDFTLVAQDRTNGWTGRARILGGNDTFRVGGEFSAEQQQNHVAIAVRATVNFVL